MKKIQPKESQQSDAPEEENSDCPGFVLGFFDSSAFRSPV
jgi:hypothetical protein